MPSVAPIAGIEVTCYKKEADNSFTNVGSSTTSSPNGTYFIGDLEAGTYTLRFKDARDSTAGYYLTSYLGGSTTLETATTFSISGGGDSSQQDYQLPIAAKVAGLTSALQE